MKATALGVVALVIMAFLVVPFVSAANADNDLYTSKYAATEPQYEKYGILKGMVRAGGSPLTTGVNLTQVATGIVTPLEIQPDGTFEVTGLTPGMYLITIADGNGGQPEQATAMVVAGQIAYPMSELLGHAFSGADKVYPKIESATYGKIIKVIDQQYVPAVPGVPAVTHQDYEAGHVHAKKVSGWGAPHDFYYNGHKYQIVGNQAEAAFIVHNYYCVHAAQMVTIIDTPAIPAVPAIPEVSHMEGSYIDVTAEVQEAANLGVAFAFNNAMQPGGIVNEAQNTVLVAIADPAVGIVKDVHIVYDGGVIDTKEYQTITL